MFKLIRDMRGGKNYDSTWGKRMKGTRPYAWMIGRRFEIACEKLGLNATKFSLSTEHFHQPRPGGGAVEIVVGRDLTSHFGNDLSKCALHSTVSVTAITT